jgi:hypothetical protein
MLQVLHVTGHIVWVPIVQHLMGLAMGAMVYALLVKRGVRRGWSILAAAPVLLDARQIQLEHYVLSETLFTFLMLAGIALLMWRDRPPLWLMGLSGLLFALATLTRTVGQPLAALIVVYLIVRRIGWRRIAVFAVALIIPIGGYMVWYHHHYGAYALNSFSGRYMWQRTTTFVDCSRTDFTDQERRICPPEPLENRELGDVYLWGLDQNHIARPYLWRPGTLIPSSKHDELFSRFAIKAIKGQPGDFLVAVGTDAWHLVQPGWQAPQRVACTTDLWTMPSGPRASNQSTSNCTSILMYSDWRTANSGRTVATVTPLNSALWAYAQRFVIPPSVLVLLSLFALVASSLGTLTRRSRRYGVREAADSALLAVMSLSILLLGVTLSVIDLRFTVPLLVLVPLSAALAAHRLSQRKVTKEPVAQAS